MKKWIFIITGTFLMAAAYRTIYDSVGMITGGFSGISIIVRKLTERMREYAELKAQYEYINGASSIDIFMSGKWKVIYKLIYKLIPEGGVPIWVTNIILNTPLFIYVYKRMGKTFVKDTLIADVLLTAYMAVLPVSDIAGTENMADYAWAAIIGGICAGTGIGMVLKAESTTGGTDMLASVIYHRYNKWSVVLIMNVIDTLIIVAGVFISGICISLWAVLAVVVTAMSARFIMTHFW